jgi:DNA polymerase-3 subunit alpha
MSAELAEEEHPPIPAEEPWSNIERCKYEKEVISTYLSGHPLDDFKYEMRLMTNIGVIQLNNLEALAGHEVKFGGLVSGCKRLVSRKGEQFGSMVIDDYSGSYELRLFGDDYLPFKSFFTDDTFMFCRAKVNSRKYKDKNGNERTYTNLKVLSMFYLGGVLDKFSSHLNFKVKLEDIDEDFCKNIEKLAKKHKGSIPLRATIIDNAQGLTLTMNTNNLRVKVRDIIPLLEQVKGVYDIQPVIRS